ncbi:MAG: flagellar hook basal-body protein [Planctomycetota bacterium]
MDDYLYSSASGLAAIHRALENSTYNTVNANTPGFQRNRVIFQNFGSFLEDSGRAQNLIAAKETVSFQQGSLRNSELPYSVALEGKGFLTVRSAEGETLYTRNGDLMTDAQGRLRTRRGDDVLDSRDDPIVIDPFAGAISIDRQGAIVQGNKEIARLKIVEFEGDSRSRLESASETLYRAPKDLEAEDATDTLVHHKYLEMPKFTGVHGTIEMLTAKKNFESMQRAIMTLDRAQEALIRGVQ